MGTEINLWKTKDSAWLTFVLCNFGSVMFEKPSRVLKYGEFLSYVSMHYHLELSSM